MGKTAQQQAGKEREPYQPDSRFAPIQVDPRFRHSSKKQKQKKLDDRFSRLLQDDDFTSKATVDRYGRKLPSGERKKYKRLYDIEGAVSQSDQGSESEESEEIDDEEVVRELQNVVAKHDPAREGGFETSSSEEESEDEDEEQEADADQEVFGFADAQNGDAKTVPEGEVTTRLAAVNMDWDNIQAVDLMAVFSNFCSSGRVLKVTVYPSEFGKERMEREHLEGPPKEIFQDLKRKKDDQSDNGNPSEEEEDEQIEKALLKEDQGEEFSSTKLRRYQLERLRYHYAVINFSTKEAAKEIYDATDGTEYLTTANFFDLRFIPDEMSFEEDAPRDMCERIPDGFRPTNFVTDALQHSKVKLTWDADDNVRKDLVGRAFSGSRSAIEENDLRAYLGASSSESSDDENTGDGATEREEIPSRHEKREAKRHHLRAALGLGKEKVSKPNREPVGDLQITFTSGLSEKGDAVFQNQPEIEETTAETYVRKEKERKKRRKEKSKNKQVKDPLADEPLINQNPVGPQPAEDLGFEDPFFADKGAESTKQTKGQRKAEREAKKRAKAEADAVKGAERERLEQLLGGDEEEVNDGKRREHFDIKAILKSEKAKARKGKGRKKALKNIGDVQEGFQMDTDDPRFSSLFQNHEYAIDPTNPKFKGTEGMKQLLETARRKRASNDNDLELLSARKKRLKE
ncbi:MAG: pre-rRNA-processing protein esf1 [Vezdaea aestivalis]|nr:MAG: pre-rRNA-processing protein esf1 [Vezdaea aestivalis]